MAGYRRLISYIYAYEGEEKGKNIGFAKLEARNGQCRLSINVKKIYAGGNDMGVYLLSSGQEIFLGNIFIRNGSGDFRPLSEIKRDKDFSDKNFGDFAKKSFKKQNILKKGIPAIVVVIMPLVVAYGIYGWIILDSVRTAQHITDLIM